MKDEDLDSGSRENINSPHGDSWPFALSLHLRLPTKVNLGHLSCLMPGNKVTSNEEKSERKNHFRRDSESVYIKQYDLLKDNIMKLLCLLESEKQVIERLKTLEFQQLIHVFIIKLQ